MIMTHQCVIVTGASRGIGAAIAIELARTGVVVGCLSRTGENPCPTDAAAEMRSRFVTAVCDVTQKDTLEAAIAKVAESTQLPISGIVNNAGLHLYGPSDSFTQNDYQRVMDTNALSVFLGSQAIYPWLIKAGHGLIVNIGSFYERLGVRQNLAYCASKAAIGAMTRCLAVEWAAKQIRVLNVAPGYIVTDLNRAAFEKSSLSSILAKRIPRGSPGQPEEVGRLVAKLYELSSGFMTGETLFIDGAQSVME